MSSKKTFVDDFDDLWAEISQNEEPTTSLNLTETQLTETTDGYVLVDALAYYSHAIEIAKLWYCAKLGRSYHTPTENKEDEDYCYKFNLAKNK